MFFAAFSGVCILLALIASYFGLRILIKLGWFAGWLRGMIGLAFVALAVTFLLVGLDLQTYKYLQEEKPLLTVSFEKVEKQHFKVKVANIENSDETSYDLYGDQWQVDARIMLMKGMLQTFGVKPGYRLDRLSGRYYSLEDEHRKKRSVYQLEESQFGIDFWSWLKDSGQFFPLIDAEYGSATFLPMEHGAIFQVSLSARGLVARPLNTIAEETINRWQ